MSTVQYYLMGCASGVRFEKRLERVHRRRAGAQTRSRRLHRGVRLHRGLQAKKDVTGQPLGKRPRRGRSPRLAMNMVGAGHAAAGTVGTSIDIARRRATLIAYATPVLYAGACARRRWLPRTRID